MCTTRVCAAHCHEWSVGLQQTCCMCSSQWYSVKHIRRAVRVAAQSVSVCTVAALSEISGYNSEQLEFSISTEFPSGN